MKFFKFFKFFRRTSKKYRKLGGSENTSMSYKLPNLVNNCLTNIADAKTERQKFKKNWKLLKTYLENNFAKIYNSEDKETKYLIKLSQNNADETEETLLTLVAQSKFPTITTKKSLLFRKTKEKKINCNKKVLNLLKTQIGKQETERDTETIKDNILNTANSQKKTPLFLAIENQNKDTLDFLLKYNKTDITTKFSLDAKAEVGKGEEGGKGEEVIKINDHENEISPLAFAIQKENFYAVKKLFEKLTTTPQRGEKELGDIEIDNDVFQEIRNLSEQELNNNKEILTKIIAKKLEKEWEKIKTGNKTELKKWEGEIQNYIRQTVIADNETIKNLIILFKTEYNKISTDDQLIGIINSVVSEFESESDLKLSGEESDTKKEEGKGGGGEISEISDLSEGEREEGEEEQEENFKANLIKDYTDLIKNFSRKKLKDFKEKYLNEKKDNASSSLLNQPIFDQETLLTKTIKKIAEEKKKQNPFFKIFSKNQFNHTKFLKSLLESKKNINTNTVEGSKRQSLILESPMETHNINIDSKNLLNKSPLELAIEFKLPEVVEALLKKDTNSTISLASQQISNSDPLNFVIDTHKENLEDKEVGKMFELIFVKRLDNGESFKDIFNKIRGAIGEKEKKSFTDMFVPIYKKIKDKKIKFLNKNKVDELSKELEERLKKRVGEKKTKKETAKKVKEIYTDIKSLNDRITELLSDEKNKKEAITLAKEQLNNLLRKEASEKIESISTTDVAGSKAESKLTDEFLKPEYYFGYGIEGEYYIKEEGKNRTFVFELKEKKEDKKNKTQSFTFIIDKDLRKEDNDTIAKEMITKIRNGKTKPKEQFAWSSIAKESTLIQNKDGKLERVELIKKQLSVI